MARYKLTLEYDGTSLIGWQKNSQGPSVQSILSDAAEKFCGHPIEFIGAGRTDAGVHAIEMVAHGDFPDTFDANTIMRAMNFYMINSPVIITDCVRVHDDFSARFDCICRHYKYIILNRPSAPILDKNRVWWLSHKLNVHAMQQAATDLIGKHDFTSFRAAQCQAKSPIKTLDTCKITRHGAVIIFEFSARSFLHHQVRNMVGTLVEIGKGKPYNIREILTAKNRSAAGPTAPACGLYFIGADYATDDVTGF